MQQELELSNEKASLQFIDEDILSLMISLLCLRPAVYSQCLYKLK